MVAGHKSKNAQCSPLDDLMRRKGTEEAWNALEEMQRKGAPVDKYTVSRLLMRTIGNGKNSSHFPLVYHGIALVEQFMQLQPAEADEVLFNALLDTCSRLRDVGRLEATRRRMANFGVQPSHVTLGILAKAYGQVNDISAVMRVWEEMSEQRSHANAVTHGCMLDACVRCGHVQKAMEIFEDLKAQKKHKNTILYTTLIKGYGLEKDLATCLRLFQEMRDEGVPYNTVTYNSVLDAAVKCSDMRTAEDLLRDMMSPGSGLEPDLVTYSTVLKGYCHAEDLDKALQVAETIKACGLHCDELVYNTLMDGCVRVNDLSAGIGLFTEMVNAGMKPSNITHSILIRLYQKTGYSKCAPDAVAQLYEHHGMETPLGISRSGRGGKGKSAARRRSQAKAQAGPEVPAVSYTGLPGPMPPMGGLDWTHGQGMHRNSPLGLAGLA